MASVLSSGSVNAPGLALDIRLGPRGEQQEEQRNRDGQRLDGLHRGVARALDCA